MVLERVHCEVKVLVMNTRWIVRVGEDLVMWSDRSCLQV